MKSEGQLNKHKTRTRKQKIQTRSMNSMEGNSMLKLDISFFTFYKNEDSPTCEAQKRCEREREREREERERFIRINSPL